MTEKRIKTSSTLSSGRIILSLLIFAIIPLVHALLKALTGDDTVAYTMALNLSACLFVLYDWNLFGVHWNRFKARLGDGLLYTAVGIVLISLWCYADRHFLSGFMLMPDPAIMHRYFFAIGAVLLAFSFCQALIVNISFKCLTDHMDIRDRELLMILVSGFLFGLLYTIAFAPLQLAVFVPSYLFNVVLVCILSYLYNQSSSFLPGIIAMGTVYMVLILLEFMA
ncbi:MAG: hypothetical protein IIY53_08790 [Solobacterium sp.]|nr:hypothetical protein [Solobacterium sp.]MBQ1321719.1 hypothetical protein [Solobacterium sp.]